MRWKSFLAVTAGCLLALVPADGVRALTLADLNAGGNFLSGDGSLTFSFDPGSVVVAGALSRDLTNYEVAVLGSGFSIVGPIGVADGNVGDLALNYSVTANDNLVIDGASIFFNGVAVGLGALAAVAVDFFSEGALVGDLHVAVTGGGLSVKTDSETFIPPLSAFTAVIKDIQVVTTEPGQIASVSVVNQEFSVIPEPATLVLLGAGVALLGALRPRGGR